jgi:glycosyltransferase involved in cell wall biosynthesis
MGNSEFHAYMLPYLARHPGVVVLHDAYLSGLYGYIDFQCGERGRYVAEMLGAHGPRARRYLAPVRRHPDPIGGSMVDLPATRSVIDQAIGLISHSPFSLKVARDSYPEGFAAPYRIIKQMINIPEPIDAATRCATRVALDLGEKDFVVATFGHLAWTKCGDRLLEAFLRSGLAGDDNAKLLFVGELAKDAFGSALRERIEKSGLGERIRITGYVDESTYARYLIATDVAVQLRTHTRGETSKAVLDCLAAAVPIIINDAASFRDYPDHVVTKIAADPDPAELAQRLSSLLAEPRTLAQAGAAGRSYAVAEHAGERIAAEYALAIDEMVQRQAAASLAGGIRDLGGLLAAKSSSDGVVAASARALCALQPAMLFRTQRLLIEVSNVADKNRGTGLQLVVSAIVRELYVSKRPGFSPLAVRLQDGHLVEAKQWLDSQGLLTDSEVFTATPSAVDIERADCLLMLDASSSRHEEFAEVFAALRAANGVIYTVIFDPLPVRTPLTLQHGLGQTSYHWLERAIDESDGLVCVSRVLADDLLDFARSRLDAKTKVTRVGYWHLGTDFIDAAAARTAPNAAIEATLAGTAARSDATLTLTWEQSAEALLGVILDQRWYRSV